MITCQYQARRFIPGVQFFCVQPKCDKFQKTVVDKECEVCLLRQPSDHDATALSDSNRQLTGIAPPGQEDVNLETLIEPKTPAIGKSLLCRLAETLPVAREQDRPFYFESNGVLVFEKREEDWEPPRALNGFVAKPENPWRFIPLWPVCVLRQQWAERTSCGWLSIHMICKCPRSMKVDCAITWKECQHCSVRESEP